MMQYLDRLKARKIIKKEIENNESLEKADLVLSGDEFWNTETIWQNGNFYNQKDFKCYFGSSWATPTLVIYYTDGKQKRVPCYFTAEESPKRAENAEAKRERDYLKARNGLKKALEKKQ